MLQNLSFVRHSKKVIVDHFVQCLAFWGALEATSTKNCDAEHWVNTRQNGVVCLIKEKRSSQFANHIILAVSLLTSNHLCKFFTYKI
jgi:hypothetical protein